MTDELKTEILVPILAQRLTGEEKFIGTPSVVNEFWRWAFSDLRDNTTRGILAEYLVAVAVGDERPMRIGWDNYDVLSPEGIRIEVKCSGYLQSWHQKTHSLISFGRLAARAFDSETNEYGDTPEVRADIFVFAVQTQKNPSEYDMIDIDHWEFWVARGASVADATSKNVGLPWVEKNAIGPIAFADLADTVRSVNAASSA